MQTFYHNKNAFQKDAYRPLFTVQGGLPRQRPHPRTETPHPPPWTDTPHPPWIETKAPLWTCENITSTNIVICVNNIYTKANIYNIVWSVICVKSSIDEQLEMKVHHIPFSPGKNMEPHRKWHHTPLFETNRCKNITLPQTSLRAVIIWSNVEKKSRNVGRGNPLLFVGYWQKFRCPPPLPSEQNERRKWKHYLAPNLVCGR